jgi:group I intron endonuclease
MTERYNLAKIYKLVNNVDDKIYVGSTCLTLTKRKSCHKVSCLKCPNQPVYKHLNEIGFNNVDIVIIESFPCPSKDELHKRERYWIDLLKPELNKNIPSRTMAEYNASIGFQKKKEYDQKPESKQKKKQYYVEHKEQIKAENKK